MLPGKGVDIRLNFYEFVSRAALNIGHTRDMPRGPQTLAPPHFLVDCVKLLFDVVKIKSKITLMCVV